MGRVKSSIDPWFATQTVEPREARSFGAAAFAPSPSNRTLPEGGVLPGAGHLALYATSTGSTTSAPGVTIDSGRCVIPGGAEYGWVGTLPSATFVPLSAPPATNPRVDLVVARVYATEYGDAVAPGFYLESVDGTPSGSPTAPNVPQNAIALADVRVATSGTITVTDRRTFTRAAGAPRLSVYDLARAGSHGGDLRITPQLTIEMWTDAGVWVPVANPAAWQQFTPTLYYSGGGGGVVNLGTGSTSIARYRKIGSELTFRYVFRWGSDPMNGGTGTIYTILPPGMTTAGTTEDNRVHAVLWTRTGPNRVNATDWAGSALIQPSDPVRIKPQFPYGGAANRSDMGFYTIATSAGVPGTGIPQISNDYPQGGLLLIQGTIEVAP